MIVGKKKEKKELEEKKIAITKNLEIFKRESFLQLNIGEFKNKLNKNIKEVKLENVQNNLALNIPEGIQEIKSQCLEFKEADGRKK